MDAGYLRVSGVLSVYHTRGARAMKIGVISDTHGSLPPLARKALEECDHIIHAGDICGQNVLLRLEQIAPVTAVYGNCDFDDYGPDVQSKAQVTLDGLRFYIAHRPQDLPYLNPAQFDVAIHGHTHIPVVKREHGVLLVNPGSPSRPRGDEGPTVACIETKDGLVKDARIIPLLSR